MKNSRSICKDYILSVGPPAGVKIIPAAQLKAPILAAAM